MVCLNAILPPRCLSCGARTQSAPALCASCWPRLVFIAAHHCAICGLPFAHPIGNAARCALCLSAPPAYERARAALAYDPASAALILPFKHGDRLDGTALFARWMAQAGAALLADADLIAPVPLHRWRFLRRRYNQAAELARTLAALSGRRLAVDLVQRSRATRSMGGLGPAARRRNLARAFSTAPGRQDEIAGRRILLVDDVFTTGATATALAQCLKDKGAAAIDILALARVVRSASLSL